MLQPVHLSWGSGCDEAEIDFLAQQLHLTPQAETALERGARSRWQENCRQSNAVLEWRVDRESEGAERRHFASYVAHEVGYW